MQRCLKKLNTKVWSGMEKLCWQCHGNESNYSLTHSSWRKHAWKEQSQTHIINISRILGVRKSARKSTHEEMCAFMLYYWLAVPAQRTTVEWSYFMKSAPPFRQAGRQWGLLIGFTFREILSHTHARTDRQTKSGKMLISM